MTEHDHVGDGEDDHHSHKRDLVHARLRASSTIMELRKILVANRGEIPIRVCSARESKPPGEI